MSQNNQQQQQQQQQQLVVNPEELEVLQDLNTQLQEARDLHRQTTDPSDKEELSLVIEELEEQLTTSLNEVASSSLGVKPFDEGKWVKEQQQQQQQQNANNNNNNTKTNPIPTPSTSSLIPAAHHLLRWEGDNKLYACNITRLFFEGNEIKCNVKIPGYPENNKKNNDLGDSISFSRQNIVSGNFDPTTAFLTSSSTPTSTTGTNIDNNNNASSSPSRGTTTTKTIIEPGAKCFAVNFTAPSASDRIFIPCVVERLTMHSTVWVVPVPATSSSTSSTVAPSSSGSSSFEVPISLVRPYSAPPSQGKLLRKKWENLTQEEKNQIIEEKKKKQQEQQEKQRRQRNETINNQASDWNKMRSLMGGSGGGRSIMGGARKF